jgi:hypothetical protein
MQSKNEYVQEKLKDLSDKIKLKGFIYWNGKINLKRYTKGR